MGRLIYYIVMKKTLAVVFLIGLAVAGFGQEYINKIICFPDGKHALTGGSHRGFGHKSFHLIKWDLKTFRVEKRYNIRTIKIYGMDMSPDGRWAALATWMKLIVFDLERDKVVRVMMEADSNDNVMNVRFVNNAKGLVSVHYKKGLRLWDIQSGMVLKRLPAEEPIGSIAVSKSPIREVAFFGDRTGKIHVWDLKSGKVLVSVNAQVGQSKQPGLVHTIAVSRNTTEALAAREVNPFPLHISLGTGQVYMERREKALQPLTSVAVSPDGSIYMAGDRKGQVFVWQPYKKKIALKRPHNEKVTAMDFSPSGNRAITAGLDGTLKVWRVSRTEVKLLAEATFFRFSLPAYFILVLVLISPFLVSLVRNRERKIKGSTIAMAVITILLPLVLVYRIFGVIITAHVAMGTLCSILLLGLLTWLSMDWFFKTDQKRSTVLVLLSLILIWIVLLLLWIMAPEFDQDFSGFLLMRGTGIPWHVFASILLFFAYMVKIKIKAAIIRVAPKSKD